VSSAKPKPEMPALHSQDASDAENVAYAQDASDAENVAYAQDASDAENVAYAQIIDERAAAAREGWNLAEPASSEIRAHDDLGRILRGEPRQLGRYVVNERLGKGGLGCVFKGDDPQLRRPVALKILNHDSPHGLQDLMREARAMVDSVRHDNICAIYDVGEEDGTAFLVMELLDGPPLWQRLPHYLGKPREVAALVATLADAVGHFYETRKIVHRDLKPENVVFTRRKDREVAVIIDFGLAKQLGGTRYTEIGMVKGTPFYMSPEQARGQVDEIDHTTDIFALGIMICKLLTGHYPQEGRTPGQEDMNILSGVTKPLRDLDKTAPEELELIVGRCLEANPKKRYPRGQALAEDLRRYLQNEPIVIPRDPWVVSAVRGLWARRQWLGPALLVVVVALGIWFYMDRRAQERLVQSMSAQVKSEASRMLEAMQTWAPAVQQAAHRPDLVKAMVEWNKTVHTPPTKSADEIAALPQRQPLQKVIDDLTHTVGNPSITTWQLLDIEGVMVARWSMKDGLPIIGKPFDDRGYFKGAAHHVNLTGPAGVHVTPAYRSRADFRYKYALSAPIVDDNNKMIGVLAVSTTTQAQKSHQNDGQRLLELVPLESDPKQQMVAIVDPDLEVGEISTPFKRGALADLWPPVLGHELDASPGGDAAVVTIEGFHDPINPSGRWLTVAAPVGNTGFVALVMAREP
jgi:predicted Ser/Thr protein kinase